MEVFAGLIADLAMYLCANSWPRTTAFFIIVALTIGAIIFFSK